MILAIISQLVQIFGSKFILLLSIIISGAISHEIVKSSYHGDDRVYVNLWVLEFDGSVICHVFNILLPEIFQFNIAVPHEKEYVQSWVLQNIRSISFHVTTYLFHVASYLAFWIVYHQIKLGIVFQKCAKLL